MAKSTNMGDDWLGLCVNLMGSLGASLLLLASVPKGLGKNQWKAIPTGLRFFMLIMPP